MHETHLAGWRTVVAERMEAMGQCQLRLLVLTLLFVSTVSRGDDTALLDGLAARGGLITLEPRTYHHTGDWLLRRNHTVVRGAGVGLTKLVMHRGTVLAQDNRSSGYSHQYTYDKPLTNIVLADFEVELVQNHSFDDDGHCCKFSESRSAVQLINVAHGELRGLRVHGASFQSISLVNCAGVHVVSCHSSFCSGTDIAINDFSMDCSLIDPLVTTEDFPAGTNFSGNYYKDDALAVQGYTRGCSIRGGTVRFAKIQTNSGAAGVKISGSDDVRVEGVFVEGHANSLTLDYSQYTDSTHGSITVTDFTGVNPSLNGLNLAGSNCAHGPYRGISIANAILRRTTPPPYATGQCVPWPCNVTGNPCPGGTLCTARGDACCAPEKYGTGNAVAIGWLDRVRLSGVEITGTWGVGVHFAGPALGLPTPNDYEVDFDGIVLDGVDTAFAFASAEEAFTRSAIMGAVVRNASQTLAGPGKDAVLASKERWFHNLREYNCTHPLGKEQLPEANRL
jgi:hypothetical protein